MRTEKILYVLMSLALGGCKTTAELGSGSEVKQLADINNTKVPDGRPWRPYDSPFGLYPGHSIGVCDTTGRADVKASVLKAVRTWLAAAGRDERLKISESCDGTRVIKIIPAQKETEAFISSSFFGYAHALKGNVHVIEAGLSFALDYTAMHEVGHIMGFAHWDDDASVMHPNVGYGPKLQSYDLEEIKRLLAKPKFADVQRAWSQPGIPDPLPEPVQGNENAPQLKCEILFDPASKRCALRYSDENDLSYDGAHSIDEYYYSNASRCEPQMINWLRSRAGLRDDENHNWCAQVIAPPTPTVKCVIVLDAKNRWCALRLAEKRDLPENLAFYKFTDRCTKAMIDDLKDDDPMCTEVEVAVNPN